MFHDSSLLPCCARVCTCAWISLCVRAVQRARDVFARGQAAGVCCWSGGKGEQIDLSATAPNTLRRRDWGCSCWEDYGSWATAVESGLPNEAWCSFATFFCQLTGRCSETAVCSRRVDDARFFCWRRRNQLWSPNLVSRWGAFAAHKKLEVRQARTRFVCGSLPSLSETVQESFPLAALRSWDCAWE